MNCGPAARLVLFTRPDGLRSGRGQRHIQLYYPWLPTNNKSNPALQCGSLLFPVSGDLTLSPPPLHHSLTMSSSPADEPPPPLGTGRPPPLTESTISLAGSERPDLSEVSSPSGAGSTSGRPLLTATSSVASMDDSTVSLAGTDRPDMADLDGEGLSSDDEDPDAGVVSGSLQFALNAPVSEVRATVQQAEPVAAVPETAPVAVKEATPVPAKEAVSGDAPVPVKKEVAAGDLGQELDEPSVVYTGEFSTDVLD